MSAAIKIIQAFAKKSLTKDKGSGITTLPSQFMAESKAGEIAALLQQAGMPLQQLDNFIKSEADLLKFLNIIEASSKPRVIPATSAEGKAITEKLLGKKGEVVSFKDKIKAMKKSGDIVGPDNLKKNDNVLTREMFKNSNLNKEPISEKFIDYTIQDINKKEPLEGMKIANKIIKREGEFKDLTEAQSQRILKETDDHLTGKDIDYDPEDFYAKGGRAGYAAGNQVTPAIDQRMNLDYNTLVDQNTAQRGFMDNWRNHAITSQKMKGKAGLESIPNYGMQSGYDFKKNFQDMNPKVAAGLSLGYQGLTEGLGMFNPNNPNFLNPMKTGKTIYNDYQKNVEGILNAEANNLTPKEQADRNKYLEVKDPVVDQNRISEIVEQQKAAGVPDEGLITNFNKPTMADVAGPSLTQYSNIPELTRLIDDNPNINSLAEANDYLKMQAGVVPGFTKLKNPDGAPGNYNEFMYKGPDGQIYGSQTYSSIAAGQYPDIYNPNSQTLSSGGRAGYYTGGMVDVEPNLSDIGHGSDALMARTRLVSPDGQATTSTGLNYLLAEDNDNIRVPFSAGGGGRRAFLKLLAALTGGAAAFKTGILGLGKGAGKQVTKEVVKSAGSGTPPPYFFKLVEKIKTLGDETLASQDKAIAKKYKDYVMEEDFAGNITIMKKGDDNLMMRDGDVYMSYKVDEVPVKGKKGSTKVEEYEEFTARPDAEGKMKDVEPGVPDEVVQEGTMFEDNMTEFGKADGGRIGLFMGGKLTAGKSLLKNMLKFMSKDGSHKKSPAEILKMMNPKQFEKLLNNPKYQGQVSSEAPEGLDKIIQDMIGKTKTDRSDMVGDIISTSRKIKKTDDDIIDYKNKIIKDLMDRGSDRETAEQFAETLALQVSKAAGKKSTPEITEQGLLELENIQKNLVTKDRKLQATGGLTTMLGE